MVKWVLSLWQVVKVVVLVITYLRVNMILVFSLTNHSSVCKLSVFAVLKTWLVRNVERVFQFYSSHSSLSCTLVRHDQSYDSF